MKQSIKETTEVLKVLPAVIAAYKSSMEDGQVDWKDLLDADVRAVIPYIYNAYMGSEKIIEELQDLDEEEAREIFDLISAVVLEVVGLLKE